ncbi:MAG: hypothetical protein WHS46_02415 [Desulfosoma sp.]
MGHHHDASGSKHKHPHSHDHQHRDVTPEGRHNHHEGHDPKGDQEPSALSMKEKLAKMLEHWIHHNEDHAVSYRRWAQHAQSDGLAQVAEVLEKVAHGSLELNDLLKKARQELNL